MFVPTGNGDPDGGKLTILVMVPMQVLVMNGSGKKIFVEPVPAVEFKQVCTMMFVGQTMLRQGQLAGGRDPKRIVCEQKSTTPQAMPIQLAVMNGQLVM